MTQSLHRSRVVPLNDPLPEIWVRDRPTVPDSTERVGASLIRVGPDHELRKALVATIDEASEVVLVASFLLSDGLIANAMIRAARRGARVYVLTASEARLEKLVSEDDDFGARMVAEHKSLLDRLADHVVLRSAGHFHAKMLVADPSSDPVGWISTANFNRALQESVELGVRLSPNDARDLAAWFCRAFWTEAERELVGKGRLARVGEPPGIPPRPRADRVVATAREEVSLRDASLELIRSAQHDLWVSSYGFDVDHEAVRAIASRARAGVRVVVLTRPRPAVLAAVKHLTDAGATVVAHDKLHAKAIIADDEALIMTANLQAYGLDEGFEVGLRLDRSARDELRQTLVDWSRSFPWRFEASLSRDQHIGEVCLASERLRTGSREVVAEHIVRIPSVTADCALRLDEASDPGFKPIHDKQRFFQRVRYEWEVVAPRLPKKAKELRREVARTRTCEDGEIKEVTVMEPYDPPTYIHRGRTLVLLESPKAAGRARELADELGGVVVLP